MPKECLFTYTTFPFVSIVYPILRSKQVLLGFKQLNCLVRVPFDPCVCTCLSGCVSPPESTEVENVLQITMKRADKYILKKGGSEKTKGQSHPGDRFIDFSFLLFSRLAASFNGRFQRIVDPVNQCSDETNPMVIRVFESKYTFQLTLQDSSVECV